MDHCPIAVELVTIQTEGHEALTRFIELDRVLWTPFLAAQPGFLHKEIWLDPDRDGEVTIVIHWASKEAWAAVPPDELKRVEETFASQFNLPHRLSERREFRQLLS